MRRAWATTLAPIGVRATRCVVRSTNATPRVSSNFFSWPLSVGCVTRQRSAARPKCERSAIATKYRSSAKVTTTLLLLATSINEIAYLDWTNNALPARLLHNKSGWLSFLAAGLLRFGRSDQRRAAWRRGDATHLMSVP